MGVSPGLSPAAQAAGITECRELHCAVDEVVEPLVARHRERLKCRRGCFDCCVDELTVFEVEAEVIRAAHPDLLNSGVPAPQGRCAFLDAEGGCRVYASRPYVCRTQGLPLRWLEEDLEGEIVEQRDICPLNLEGPRLVDLPEADCFQLGLFEERLISVQLRAFSRLERVELRSLFRQA